MLYAIRYSTAIIKNGEILYILSEKYPGYIFKLKIKKRYREHIQYAIFMYKEVCLFIWFACIWKKETLEV